MEARNPVVSGLFYSSHPAELKGQLHGMFSGLAKDHFCPAVVSPHAGYAFSGQSAVHAAKALRDFESVIIAGPNHTGLGGEFSASERDWETPLGRIEIDARLLRKITKLGFVDVNEEAHEKEHSIEVQLPVLQYYRKGFKFLPVCIKNIGYSEELMKNCTKLGDKIAKILKEDDRTVFIASSDFSHYIPADIANQIDTKAAEKILGQDIPGFFNLLEKADASICGYGPIAVAMQVALKMGLKSYLLHSSNSGEVSGDMSSVVSYKAIGFE